ncbi:hypothetical protein FHS20_003786 [Phyllobacterium endophyticum]|nr:hypothetical protein [Phyllobacterium endophyticum]
MIAAACMLRPPERVLRRLGRWLIGFIWSKILAQRSKNK